MQESWLAPIRKAIRSLDLSLHKHFDQINYIPTKLISLIGLITENNSSCRNASQSTLTIAELIVYNYKKGTRKRESTVDKVSINQLRKRETPAVTYISLKLYSSTRSKMLLQKLHQTGICSSYQHVMDIIFDWATNALQVYKNSHQVIPLKLDKILGHTSIITAALQTATVDVNHIHKARYSVQLSVVSIYNCLEQVDKAINFVLPLFSLAEERSSYSRMFKYWILIMKFQINYPVFIRTMREVNFKLFVKILISLIKWFFIFDHDNYARLLSVHIQDLLSLPITCPQLYQDFERGNFVV